MRTLHRLSLIVIAVFSFDSQQTMATPGDEKWAENYYSPGLNFYPGYPNTDYISNATRAGNYLYVSGRFNRIGGVSAKGVARLNYSTGLWERLAGGVEGTTASLASLGDDVYVSGISQANNTGGPLQVGGIARWDGSNFFSVQGTPTDGSAGFGQMVTVGESLFVNGFISGYVSNSIYRLSTGGWNRIGLEYYRNNYNYPYYMSGQLVADGGYLYCQSFLPAGNNTHYGPRVARWNGSSWSSVSGDMTYSSGGNSPFFTVVNGQVYAASTSGGARYTDSVNGTRDLTGVVKWTGTQWVQVDGTFGGAGNIIYGLVNYNGSLVALGNFTTINDNSGQHVVNRMALWNGSNWNAIGQGTTIMMNGAIGDGSDLIAYGAPYNGIENNAINPDGTQIYTGGIVRWNGNSWEAVGGGLGADREVEAMTSLSNELYLAGYSIRRVGQTRVPRIAKVNPATGVVTGLGEFRNASYDGTVYDACTYDGQVVMGGSFTTALVGGGSQTVNNIARWNGSAWNPLGSGVNGAVRSIVVKDGSLYVAGEFTQATDSQGTKTVNRVARWNGTAWSALGTGISASRVSSLCFVGADLYAGTYGPGAVWRWTGSAWTNMAALNYYDEPTLGSYRGHLVVGGVSTITPTGGAAVQVNGLAHLQGTSWIRLGDGLGAAQSYPWVESIREVDGRLYVGGRFGNSTNPNSPPAGFGVWDGTDWSTVGSGIANSSGPSAGVYCIHAGERDMFIGGFFDTAGGKYVGNYSSFSLMPTGAQTFEAWALEEGLSGADAQPGATPRQDGVVNLIKYAFNLDGSSADVHRLEEGTGRGGLPAVRYVGGVLRVEFLRRVGSALYYRPMKSISLAEGSWSDFTDAPTIQSFGVDWERVIYEEPIPPNTTRIFGTVQVSLTN